MTKRLLGQEHPDVATDPNNLALVYKKVPKQYSGAESLYADFLEVKKWLVGQERSDIATSVAKLAGFYKAHGYFSDAELLYTESLQSERALLGQEDPDVIASLKLAPVCVSHPVDASLKRKPFVLSIER